MPAITVADTTVLPRLVTPGLADRTRTPLQITTAPRDFEGEGFPVKRAFAGIDLSLIDPFIMLDEMGAVEYAPGEPKGTPWHPHRGFETVTYIMDGQFDHRDSQGGGGTITNGDTQWMTAGSGLLHIEAPPEWLVAAGGLFHGLQLWVNLPSAQKMTRPKYQDLRATEVGLATSADGASLVRIIAGELPTAAGTVGGPGSTTTPMSMMHITIPAGARVDLPWPKDFNALVYVMAGRGSVGAIGQPIHHGQAAVLGSGEFVSLAADAEQDAHMPSLEVIVLGGRPIAEPIAWAGPFVMNTRAELATAMDDYTKGRLGQIPAL